MRDGIEDLSVHARRGELGESGQRVLSLALRASWEALLLHEAGCAFDALDSILPGDDAIAQRAIHRVLATRQRARRWRPRYARVALATLAWAAAAAAAAPLLLGSEVTRPTDPSEMTPRERFTRSLATRKRAAQAATPVVSPVASVPSETAPSAPSDRLTSNRRMAAAVREYASSVQAFAEANRLRRLGRISEAISGYQSLQRNFPGTDEAQNADIALGMLRLQTGAARAALANFRRYLKRNASSQLAPEALFGEAQALEALGQKSAALQSYAFLLRRYPDSAYAGAAKAKLQTTP